MVEICQDSSLTTVINVFKVPSDRQAELVGLLTDLAEQTVRGMPGYVSTSIHASLDGTRVVNYAQWRSPEDLFGMLSDPDAQAKMQLILDLAESEPNLYQVTKVHEN